MSGPSPARRLAAILAADVVGYSRLTAQHEDDTLRALAAHKLTVRELVAEHGGRIFATAGDGIVAEFASAVRAVHAAVAIQRAITRHNQDVAPDRRMEFRIGINLGDVVAEGDDLLGDGVNVAARVQALAQPSGVCVTGAIRDQIDGKHHFGIVDLGPHPLKNIPRPVTVCAVDFSADAVAAGTLQAGPQPLPDKPSIGVLPFVNMTGDREQEYFADGITEDIITALSHYRWFFVIARNSTFAYKGRAVDVKQIARELGVRYILEGSVRRVGDRVRVTAQLIECDTGNHLLAERFDREVSDIFALQDAITESVVAAIEPEMLLTEGRRASRKATTNLDAFDQCMRGIWLFQQFSRDENRQAEAVLRSAIDLDPKLAMAHMGLARTLNTRIWWGWSDDIDRDLAAEVAAADEAVRHDGRDPYCQYAMFLACMLTLQHDRSLAAAQRAIDLTPNFALGYFALGWIRIYMGRAAEALEPMLHSLRLNPNDRQSETFLGQAAIGHYHLGNFEDAVDFCRRALRVRRHRFILRTLLAALGQAGRVAEAAAVIDELNEQTPAQPARHWQVTMPYSDRGSLAFFEDGLHKAGYRDG